MGCVGEQFVPLGCRPHLVELYFRGSSVSCVGGLRVSNAFSFQRAHRAAVWRLAGICFGAEHTPCSGGMSRNEVKLH